MALSAELLIFNLHGSLLRELAVAAGIHFEGLEQAGRKLRVSGLIDANAAKRLAHLDHAFNFMRHTTEVRATSFKQEIMGKVAMNKQSKSGHEATSILSKTMAEFEEAIENIKRGGKEDAPENQMNTATKRIVVEACDEHFRMLRGKLPSCWPPIVGAEENQIGPWMTEKLGAEVDKMLQHLRAPRPPACALRELVAERCTIGFAAWKSFVAQGSGNSSSSQATQPPAPKRQKMNAVTKR